MQCGTDDGGASQVCTRRDGRRTFGCWASGSSRGKPLRSPWPWNALSPDHGGRGLETSRNDGTFSCRALADAGRRPTAPSATRLPSGPVPGVLVRTGGCEHYRRESSCSATRVWPDRQMACVLLPLGFRPLDSLTRVWTANETRPRKELQSVGSPDLGGSDDRRVLASYAVDGEPRSIATGSAPARPASAMTMGPG